MDTGMKWTEATQDLKKVLKKYCMDMRPFEIWVWSNPFDAYQRKVLHAPTLSTSNILNSSPNKKINKDLHADRRLRQTCPQVNSNSKTDQVQNTEL
uniref:Uncharacterized protein n=1 Tax=Megaselia scalaris TaxID=36166 RepID=T1GIK2_MEGSC